MGVVSFHDVLSIDRCLELILLVSYYYKLLTLH